MSRKPMMSVRAKIENDDPLLNFQSWARSWSKAHQLKGRVGPLEERLAMLLQVDIVMIAPFLSQRTMAIYQSNCLLKRKGYPNHLGDVRYNTWINTYQKIHPPLLEQGCVEVNWKMSWFRCISQCAQWVPEPTCCFPSPWVYCQDGHTRQLIFCGRLSYRSKMCTTSLLYAFAKAGKVYLPWPWNLLWPVGS